MNIREAKREGRYTGRMYTTWLDISGVGDPVEGWLKGVTCEDCMDVHNHPVDWLVCMAMGAESNGRQYSGDLSYEIAKEPNSEALFDAYEAGIYLGARDEARRIMRNLFTRTERSQLNQGNLKAHGLTFVVNADNLPS